jgi:O-acetylserine/cysteine efflux transporter
VVIASTLVAFGIWNQLLSRYPAHSVAPYSLLVPVIGLITAWLVLGETPGNGGAGVLVGLLAISWRPQTRTTDAAHTTEKAQGP